MDCNRGVGPEASLRRNCRVLQTTKAWHARTRHAYTVITILQIVMLEIFPVVFFVVLTIGVVQIIYIFVAGNKLTCYIFVVEEDMKIFNNEKSVLYNISTSLWVNTYCWPMKRSLLHVNSP